MCRKLHYSTLYCTTLFASYFANTKGGGNLMPLQYKHLILPFPKICYYPFPRVSENISRVNGYFRYSANYYLHRYVRADFIKYFSSGDSL